MGGPAIPDDGDMTTLYYTHSIFLEHDTGAHHPEHPDRLRAVWRALEGEEFMLLDRRDAPEASVAQLTLQHDPAYVEFILDNVPEADLVHLDADTCMSPASGEAALRAAGAVCAAVEEVMAGRARNAFCAVRPPGHHAERNRAMGFCLFNNVAIGAAHARKDFGAKRVAVIDFDVHHGNGTQDMLANDPHMFYGSTHQSPGYPGTGAAGERGVADNVVNVELAPGTGSDAFRQAYADLILPRLEAFKPELIMISAGFDAHARDPLAYLRLKNEDFGWLTAELVDLANRLCAGRVVSALEGGYDLEGLAGSVAAHVRALMMG